MGFFLPIPGNFFATLARTADFCADVPLDDTRDKALRAWLASFTGYLRSDGMAKSDVGRELRCEDESFAIFIPPCWDHTQSQNQMLPPNLRRSLAAPPAWQYLERPSMLADALIRH